MHLPFARTFTSLVALCLGGTMLAQDTRLPAFGSPVGTAFEANSPVDAQIFVVGVQSGGFLDGVSVTCRDRSHHALQGGGTLYGGWGGVPAAFQVPLNDYLFRVDVWTDVGFVRGMALETRHGYRQMYGYAIGASYTFQPGSNREIVGLHGTYSQGLITSLGVITRRVLATSALFGTPCGLQYLRFRPGGNDRFVVGGSAIVEMTNVPAGHLGMMMVGLSTTAAGPFALPLNLGFIGAPACTAYVSNDSLVFLGADPSGTVGHTLLVPNDNALVGLRVAFQGYVDSGFNAANLSATNALGCTVGLL